MSLIDNKKRFENDIEFYSTNICVVPALLTNKTTVLAVLFFIGTIIFNIYKDLFKDHYKFKVSYCSFY